MRHMVTTFSIAFCVARAMHQGKGEGSSRSDWQKTESILAFLKISWQRQNTAI